MNYMLIRKLRQGKAVDSWQPKLNIGTKEERGHTSCGGMSPMERPQLIP